MAATDHTAVELSYCSVKNGVNDMLDYIALVVALVSPFIIGPCIVGVFQVIISLLTQVSVMKPFVKVIGIFSDSSLKVQNLIEKTRTLLTING